MLGDGGTAGESSVFDAYVPLVAAFPAAFFIACGQPNQERSSPPLLTVLLLLTGEIQEEGEGGKNEETGPLRVGIPQGSFFALAEREVFRIQSQCLEDRAAAEFSPKPVAEIVVP